MNRLNSRLANLRRELAGQELVAILISQPENRFYLSGFDGSAGYLLVTADNATLATDFRYTEQAERQAPDCSIFQITGPISAWLPDLVAGVDSGNKVGFEAGDVSFALHRQLTEVLAGTNPDLYLAPVD